MMPKWMKDLSKPENNKAFSELCHQYFKLATMRVMQDIRDKHSVPKEEIATLTLAIFARFFNEGCYAVGTAIKNGMHINQFLSKEHRLTLLKVLNGEGLDQLKREDIDTDIERSLQKFKEFILEEGGSFTI